MPKKDDLVYEPEATAETKKINPNLLKIKQKLVDCQKQKEEYLAGWQRAQADLVNFRRRQEETLKNLPDHIRAEMIKALLPVFDTLIHASQNSDLKLIHQQLFSSLTAYGFKEIKTQGEKFDPHFHEAVLSEKSEKTPGTILAEIQKGYLLNNLVLRPAKVKISH